MIRCPRLESILAGGVLVAALAVLGSVPVDAQPASSPAAREVPVPVPGPAVPDDVGWGPVVEEQPAPETAPAPLPPGPAPAPEPRSGRPQERGGDDREPLPVPAAPDDREPGGGAVAPEPEGGSELRNPDGSPTPANPGFFEALPGPSVAQGVPNFVIRKFRVPLFLLPIYQAAGIEYGIRWEILAAINEIETDYGRNLNVSSAGALGWMQFMPSSWEAYGVDANKDGRKDPYNPVDAIFAAARYLKAANYDNDVRGAIFAYNHADWYVDSVLLRARLISGVPADLVGSLTGLTEGRFPVAARARYADDLAEQEAVKRVQIGENAANIVESQDDRRSIEIYAREGAPVVAVSDGIVEWVRRGEDGDEIAIQDVYGNRYTYSGLGELSRFVPGVGDAHGPQVVSRARPRPREDRGELLKERLFAHPDLPAVREAGGHPRLRPLEEGAQVIGGTILGRVGKVDAEQGAHLDFAIRPAGKGAPSIDPKPILDGWKLLEATAIYRAAGKNVLYGRDAKAGSLSIGQILLLSKPLLEKRVLADERIEIYESGRTDIQSGQIDRRVLATIAYLAESGLRPTITSLKAGHSFLTASGNVSHHSSGNAVDIAEINGVPIYGHQEPGGVTDQAVRRLMRLQGTMRPSQIISLLDYGQNTMAMSDHHDHIHVGFQPMFGTNRRLGQQALAVLEPGQWSDLIARLREIDNPVVPTEPSKYSLPADDDKPASHAHDGE